MSDPFVRQASQSPDDTEMELLEICIAASQITQRRRLLSQFALKPEFDKFCPWGMC